jgi:hypothetical protein
MSIASSAKVTPPKSSSEAAIKTKVFFIVKLLY